MRIPALLALVAIVATAACTNIPGLTQRVCPNRWFDEADTDRDRTVTTAEYDAWRASCKDCDQWKGWFATGDADKDGRVTIGETCNIKGVPYAEPTTSPAPSASPN